ncbi:MAG TPA: aminotransferase class V-fold PLP-dependent enzyme [Nannocystaceae bacterium]|nr:aminotransferase class V-fold PLP-dependent enzyme [Nannocystaceae bacterium]
MTSAPWGYKDFVKDALTRIPEMSCEEVGERIAAHRPVVFLDIREGDELGGGILPNAVLLPRGLLEKHVHEHVPERDSTVVVYCATGNRSALAADAMQRMGYASVYNLAGGIERWRHLGMPVEGTGGARLHRPQRDEPAAAGLCMLPGGKLSWDDVRREFAIVARRVPVLGSGERPLVYLDHAASTHAPMSVLSAYVEFLEREYANVHRATHLLSRKATERFEEAYYVVADHIGAELRQGCVVFCPNTTTAIDLASFVMANRPGKVITTEMEHHSNELPHRRRGSVLRARVTETGELDLDHLETLLRRNEVKLVAVTAASNVTGLVPDVHRIARLAHENGALILVDAAQAIARMPIDVRGFDDPEHIDFLAAAGHKAYAPFGAGFLYGPRGVMGEAPPYVPGGGTASAVGANTVEFLDAPDRHHGGTPNIAGVVGMSRALLFLQSIGLAEVREHERALTRKLVDGLQELGGVTIYGAADPNRRLGVVAFNVAGVSDLMTAAVLSEEGALAVRNGRFCAHIYVERLLSMQPASACEGTSGERPTGAVRASVGLYTDEPDVDRLLEFVKRVRDRKWMGRYRVRGESVSAEFAGRCADHWMEPTQESGHAHATGDEAAFGYEFEVLQADGTCRSYLIADPTTGDAMIVDPLRERVDDVLDRLAQKRWKLRYTVETHTHADHLSGSVRLKDLTGARMLMHSGSPAPCVDRALSDGDVIELGNLRIEVIATPGHTSDSMVLVLPGRVLTGDTLLIGGCGRTDLPTGDAVGLWDSLKRVLELPDDTLVFPAHDYRGQRASTIGRERQQNPRLQHERLEEFVAAMAALELPTPPRLREALAANQNCL